MPALKNEAHESFCQEYAKTFNATHAYFRCGISKSKNERSAAVQGYKLLRKHDIAARVKEILQGKTERIQIETDNILMELAILGFSDIKNICSWNDGGLNLKSSDELSPMITKAIKEVTYTFSEGSGRVQIKMHDKFPALEKLGKHLGMFPIREKDADPAKITEKDGTEAKALIEKLTTVLKDKSCQSSSQSQSPLSPAPSSLGLLGDTKKER